MSPNNTVPCWIDGKPYTAASSIRVLDPHDPSKQLWDASCVSTEDADKAIASAWKAYATWSKTTHAERRAIFLRLANILREKTPQIVETEVSECTSTAGWATACLNVSIGHSEELAGIITQLTSTFHNNSGAPGTRTHSLRVPFGVVLGIAPWNAPFALAYRAVIQPIIAGNTAILKTNEYSPKTMALLGPLLKEAGLPDGVLNIVNVAPKDAPTIVEHIIADHRVRKVNFTGSTIVGSKIAEMCGRHLKPCVMELGGKAPLIVLEDADIDNAARSAIMGGFLNSGQICQSSDNVLVHSSIADAFTERVVALAKKVRLAADSPKTRGLFTPSSAQRIHGLVSDAVDKGADLLVGSLDEGKPEHNLLQPFVVANITPSMRLAQEEIFGPTISITRFDSDAEAIELANRSPYGLAAAVHGSEARAWAVSEDIEAGMIFINGMTIEGTAQTRHGGVKKSGWGTFNGLAGLQEFTTLKTVIIKPPNSVPSF